MSDDCPDCAAYKQTLDDIEKANDELQEAARVALLDTDSALGMAVALLDFAINGK